MRSTLPFTTSSGLELTLKPVRKTLLAMAEQAALRECRERGIDIDPPKYKVESVGGDAMEFDHEAPSDKGPGTLDVEDPAQTKINWARWNKYAANLNTVRQAQLAKRMFAMFELGVECAIPEDGWAEQQENIGIEVPKEPAKRKVHYLTTVALSSTDMTMIMTSLQLLEYGEAVREEDLKEMEALFRSTSQDTHRDTIRALIAGLREVVSPSKASGAPVDAEAQPDAEPVG